MDKCEREIQEEIKVHDHANSITCLIVDIQEIEEAGEDVTDQDKAEHYVMRLENGLNMLQLVDFIAAEVVVGCKGQVRLQRLSPYTCIVHVYDCRWHKNCQGCFKSKEQASLK